MGSCRKVFVERGRERDRNPWWRNVPGLDVLVFQKEARFLLLPQEIAKESMILSGMFIAFMDLMCCGKGCAGSHRATEWGVGIVGSLFNRRKNNHAGRDISGIFLFVIENCPVPFHPSIFSIVRRIKQIQCSHHSCIAFIEIFHFRFFSFFMTSWSSPVV